MPETINLSVQASVAGGPVVSDARAMEVEAYDKIRVTVPAPQAAPAGVTVELQPGAAGQVTALFITSSRYDPAPLTYEVNAAGPDVVLDGPVALVGSGAVSLLNAAPATLVFTNGGNEDAEVQILIGRDATS